MLLGLIRRIPPRYRWPAGTCALLLTAWVCMYGKIWSFEKFEAHRFTSMAMLTGTLRLRSQVMLDGPRRAGLQRRRVHELGLRGPAAPAPVSRARGRDAHLLQGFFPDRAIYFLYLAVAMPVLWAAFDRLLAMRPGSGGVSRGMRMAIAWAATWMVLQVTLFPFMETRFVVYEETLAYMTLAELMAFSAYVFALRTWSTALRGGDGDRGGAGDARPADRAPLRRGVGRPRGARAPRPAGRCSSPRSVAPFFAFFLYSNWVRSGSLVGLGYENSNPAWEYETALLRFGSDVRGLPLARGGGVGAALRRVLLLHLAHAELRLAEDLPLRLRGAGRDARAVLRPRRPRAARVDGGSPRRAARAAALAVAALRGDGRSSSPPSSTAARGSRGATWATSGRSSCSRPRSTCTRCRPTRSCRSTRGWRRSCSGRASSCMVRFLVPWEWDRRADVLEPHGGFNTTHGTETLAEDFRESRWGVDGPMPSRIACASRPRWPYHNGLGWKDGCAVDPATNVYLGVASKDGDHYALRFETADMTAPTVKVYVNGKLYTAERRGDAYEADVGIRYASLHSAIVMVTLLWTREETPPTGKLLAVELV